MQEVVNESGGGSEEGSKSRSGNRDERWRLKWRWKMEVQLEVENGGRGGEAEITGRGGSRG